MGAALHRALRLLSSIYYVHPLGSLIGVRGQILQCDWLYHRHLAQLPSQAFQNTLRGAHRVLGLGLRHRPHPRFPPMNIEGYSPDDFFL